MTAFELSRYSVSFDTNVFYFDRWLARITAQACRQPGLSYVFTELFNYDDAEIYVEENDCNGRPLDFSGVSFKDAIGQFTQSTLIGVVRKDSVDGTERMHIAPKTDFEIQQGDKFIALSRMGKTETGTRLEQQIISVDKLKKCFWRIA